MTKLFTLITWYFTYDHSGWVFNWHNCFSGALWVSFWYKDENEGAEGGWVRIHKIRICEHNLHPEHLILHIWSLWVGTQLTKVLSSVPDALLVRFLDLKMKNEPNYHNIMAHGGQKSQYPHLWTQSSLWQSDTSYMVTLGGYPTYTIAFKCCRCFMGQIVGSKDEKWAKLSYNYGPWGSEITKSAFVNTIFTLNIWYFIYGHSMRVPNWHNC